MDRFSYIISLVPSVVWSAIIAAFLTFLGIRWINRYRNQKQSQQPSPAREECKFQSEQNIAFKKEAYFEMAAIFSRTIGTFRKLTSLDFSDKEPGEYAIDPEEAIAKALLIADADTVSKLLEFTFELNQAFILLIKQREILLDHNKSIDTDREMIADANREKDRLITILKESNMQGQGDIYTLTSIEDSYKSQDEIIATARNNIDEREAIFKTRYREFIKDCWSAYSRFNISMAPIIIAVRNELDSDIDANEFEEIIQKSMSRIISTIDSVALTEEK
jgi:hypothetical protein